MTHLVHVTLGSLSVLLSTLTCASPALAYKTSTHADITRESLSRSRSYTDSQVLFDASDDVLERLAIFGSIWEDLPFRFVHHFYDPVFVRGLVIAGSKRGKPAVDRAWDSGEADYSWTHARNYMFEALTATDIEARQASARKLARSLGHVVHLLQDMAQPSHTRNDAHVSHSEEPTGLLAKAFNPSHLEDWAQNHPAEVQAMIAAAHGAAEVSSFNEAFETTARLSNLHFFSDDTILTDYASPAMDDTDAIGALFPFGLMGNLVHVRDEDGQSHPALYIHKTTNPNFGMKLANVSYFGAFLQHLPGLRRLAFQIDDEVARENATFLIPEAVRYSAGLLDYFLRGRMKADGTPVVSSAGTTGIVVRVTNETPDEIMGPGTLTVAYEYRAGGASERSFAASAPLDTGGEVSHDDPRVFEFTFAAPIPADAEGIRYALVFQGQLGDEEGAVAAAEIATCLGFCEDWESGEWSFLSASGVSTGPTSFETDNGTWSSFGGSGGGGTLSASIGTGLENSSRFLDLQINISRHASDEGAAGRFVFFTFGEPLPLEDFPKLSFDYFVSVGFDSYSDLDFYFVDQGASVAITLSEAIGPTQSLEGLGRHIIILPDSTDFRIYTHHFTFGNFYHLGVPGRWNHAEIDLIEYLHTETGIPKENIARTRIRFLSLQASGRGGRYSWFSTRYGFDNISLHP